MLAKINDNIEILGFLFDTQEFLYHAPTDTYRNVHGNEVYNAYEMFMYNKIIRVGIDGVIFKKGEIVNTTTKDNKRIEYFFHYNNRLMVSFVNEFNSSIDGIEHVTQIEPLNVNTLQTKILSNYNRPIRLANTLKKSIAKLTLYEFLKEFFETYNHERDTIYADNTSEVQTEMSKRRSLGDIFMLCRYYFPNCTLKDVLKILYVDLHNLVPGFRTSWCNQIHKRVWYLEDSDDENEQCNKTQTDEYGYKFNDYVAIL